MNPNTEEEQVSTTERCVEIAATAPTELLKGDSIIAVKYPFMSEKWADVRVASKYVEVLSVIKLPVDSATTKLAICGRGFYDKDVQVHLDKLYSVGDELELIDSSLLLLKVENDVLKDAKHILLMHKKRGIDQVVSLTPEQPTVPEPKLTENQEAPKVQQHSAPGVVFKGTDFGVIGKATFGSEDLLEVIPKPVDK